KHYSRLPPIFLPRSLHSGLFTPVPGHPSETQLPQAFPLGLAATIRALKIGWGPVFSTPGNLRIWFWTRIATSHYNRPVKHGAGFPKRAKARSQPPFFGEGKAGVKKLRINLENPLCSSEIELEVFQSTAGPDVPPVTICRGSGQKCIKYRRQVRQIWPILP
ncbi:MAG: hypothetical protein DRI65_12985, partial [Chloroflexota bacterium]